MIRKLSFLLLFFVLTASCPGAEKSAGTAQKLAPPPILLEFAAEKVKVIPTGEFTSIPLPAQKAPKKNVKKSSAFLVSERDKKFFWKPSPLLSSTIRVADLTGAALSEDGSLAVVTERIGGERKANSTRFLFFDIENKQLSGGFVIPEMLISDIAFIPGSKTCLIGICHKFAPFKTPDGLVRIDLEQKDIADAADSPAGKVTSFCFGSRESLFYTAAGENSIFKLSLRDLGAAPQKIKSSISAPRVCNSGNDFIAYGRKGIEIFRLDHGRWIPDDPIRSAPADFAPVNCFLIDPVVPAFCFTGGYEEPLWYFRGNNFTRIKERVSGLCLWNKDAKLFFAELAANSRIAILQMPGAEEKEKPAAPNRIKPANRNGNFALLHVPVMKNTIVQIDNRGNVFLLDHSRLTRWRKSVICITDRAGFR